MTSKMSKISKSIYTIHFLDETASKNSVIHVLNPVLKLILTVIYIVTILSFGKYEVSGLMPYVFYPVIIFILSEVPFVQIFKRVFMVLPFVFGLGIFNPIFDTKVYAVILGVEISAGWISLVSLIIKFTLTVLSGLLLISTTGIEKIAFALRKLMVPKIFVTQMLLTYRYISVLLEEAALIVKAYSLRAPLERGVKYKAYGSLLGQMLLRAFDRANRVYNAMILRGFNGEYYFENQSKMSADSILYFVIWSVFFINARMFNIVDVLGRIMSGVFF
jgi:cobalt/nickel transport system permease protein